MRNPTRTLAVLVGCGTSGTAPSGSGAGSSTAAAAPPETNPAGDIPDKQAFVPFTPPGGLVAVSVPEGWARSTDGGATIFTDKLNTVRIETRPLATAPNTQSVSLDELPIIASSTPGYRSGTVSAVQRTAGPVMLITRRTRSPVKPGPTPSSATSSGATAAK